LENRKENDTFGLRDKWFCLFTLVISPFRDVFLTTSFWSSGFQFFFFFLVVC
jgi:hypothetical protein